MSHKDEYQPKLGHDRWPASKLTRRGEFLLRLVGAGVSVAAAVGTVKVAEAAEYKQVDTDIVHLLPGEAPQTAVERGVVSIADKNHFDADKVGGVVWAAQDAYGDFTPGVTKQVPQMLDQLQVTVSKNGFGSYKVDADPIDAND